MQPALQNSQAAVSHVPVLAGPIELATYHTRGSTRSPGASFRLLDLRRCGYVETHETRGWMANSLRMRRAGTCCARAVACALSTSSHSLLVVTEKGRVCDPSRRECREQLFARTRNRAPWRLARMTWPQYAKVDRQSRGYAVVSSGADAGPLRFSGRARGFDHRGRAKLVALPDLRQPREPRPWRGPDRPRDGGLASIATIGSSSSSESGTCSELPTACRLSVASSLTVSITLTDAHSVVPESRARPRSRLTIDLTSKKIEQSVSAFELALFVRTTGLECIVELLDEPSVDVDDACHIFW